MNEQIDLEECISNAEKAQAFREALGEAQAGGMRRRPVLKPFKDHQYTVLIRLPDYACPDFPQSTFITTVQCTDGIDMAKRMTQLEAAGRNGYAGTWEDFAVIAVFSGNPELLYQEGD